MGRLRLWPILAVLSACRADPVSTGESLRCDDDGDCASLGDKWRCRAGGCFLNTAPDLTPPADATVLVDTDFTSDVPAVFDPEGDDVTISWVQVSGPMMVLTAAMEADALTVRPPAAGLYVFEVTARDSWASSEPRTFELFAAAEADAMYISTLGADTDTCGERTEPCASPDWALGRMRADGRTVMLVAASQGASKYDGCLSVTGNERVLGCYDPLTWTLDPDRRGLCRMECDDGLGHTAGGDAIIENVTLALVSGTPVVLGPAIPFPLTTLRVTDGAPQIRGVDIEGSACGSPCEVAAILSTDSNPTFFEVELRPSPSSSAVPWIFYGAVIVRGAATFAGTGMRQLTDPVSGRGGINVNASVTGAVAGILALEADILVQDVLISGGLLAPVLNGIKLYDSRAAIIGNAIRVQGVASNIVVGVESLDCSSAPGWCVCEAWSPDCLMTPPVAPMPDVTVAANDIAVGDPGLPEVFTPCILEGVAVSTANGNATVSGNVIGTGQDATLSLGIMGFSGNTAVGTLRAEANDISIWGGDSNSACRSLNRSLILTTTPLADGAVGMALAGAPGSVLWGNNVYVAVHARNSVGVWVEDSGDTTISENFLAVGIDSLSRFGEHAVGAHLLSTPLATVSYFDRNSAVVADASRDVNGVLVGGSMQGTGLRIEDSENGTSLSHSLNWEVTNNFLWGGKVPHATGLVDIIRTSGLAYPLVAHNTVAAGGDPDIGLTSTAVRYVQALLDDEPRGELSNNLLDAGDAAGRQILMDVGVDTVAEPAHAGNLAQYGTVMPSVRPTIGVGFDSNFMVLLPTAGAVTVIGAPGSALGEDHFRIMGFAQVYNLVPARPLAGWAGPTAEGPTVVTAGEAGIAVNVGQFLSVTDPQRFIPLDIDGRVIVPTHVAMAELRGGPPTDVVFANDLGSPLNCPGGQNAYDIAIAPGTSAGFDTPFVLTSACGVERMGASSTSDLLFILEASLLTVLTPIGVTAQPRPAQLMGEVQALTYGYIDSTPGLDIDVVAVVDGGLHVWLHQLNADLLATEAVIADPPCVGSSAITAVIAGWTGAPVAYPLGKVLVGCADGAVEVYGHHMVLNQLDRLARGDPTFMPSPEILSLIPSESGSALSDGKLLVTYVDDERMARYSWLTGDSMVMAPPTLTSIASASIMARIPTFVFGKPNPSLTSVYTAGEIDMGDCPLAYREPGGAAADLHLAAGANDCVDGAAGMETDDRDGCSARSVAPDVGADERDAAGTACTPP